MEPCKRSPQTCVIMGVPFGNVTFLETLNWIHCRIQSRQPTYIATANMDFIMQAWQDPELQRILIEAGLVVADGAPIVKESAGVGPALKGRVTGSDLVPLIAGMAATNNFSVFLLGGAPGVADKAARLLCKIHPNLTVAGCYSPPLASLLDMDHAEILKRLEIARPDILLVAFGAPKQEKWINMHFREWNIPVAIGIGGTFDFLAGTQIRAPRWVQHINMEWLWRLGTNPKRLAGRYIKNIRFFMQLRKELKTLLQEPNVPDTYWTDDVLKTLPVRCTPWPLPAHLATDEPMVINASSCQWLDSAELGELIDYIRQNRATYLVGIGSRIRRLITLYHLENYVLMPENKESLAELLSRHRHTHGFTITTKPATNTPEAPTLHVHLPSELTAVHVPDYRIQFHDEWLRQAHHLHELIIDASDVAFIDSSGIGFLRHMQTECSANDIPFVCRGFQGTALTVLQVAHVADTLLDTETSS